MKRIVTLVVAVILTLPSFAQTERPKAEPTDTNVIATALGKKITAAEKDHLNSLIFGSLLRQYAKDNKLEPTQVELDAFVKRSEAKERQLMINFQSDRAKLAKEIKSASLSDQEREKKTSELKRLESILKSTEQLKEMAKGMEDQMRPIRRQMAQEVVTSWKVNKALYAKYGGRVIFQQAGVEPLDAYRDFLKEQEQAGRFQILDKQYESGFWRYFTNDALHTFYKKEDAARVINTPWWMMDEPAGK